MKFELSDEMIQEIILSGMTDKYPNGKLIPLCDDEAAERIDYLMNVFLKSDIMKKAFESWLNLKFDSQYLRLDKNNNLFVDFYSLDMDHRFTYNEINITANLKDLVDYNIECDDDIDDIKRYRDVFVDYVEMCNKKIKNIRRER